VKAFVVSTGDELVRGRTEDTNTAEIARALLDEGVEVLGAEVVGDDAAALEAVFRRALAAAETVVVSGGLGPTEDDCTRAAAAAAGGVALERVPELEAALRARFTGRGMRMPESNLLQADRPVGAETLPNRLGTAPGFAMRVGGATLYALPGPPMEMRAVLAEEVLPRLRALLPSPRRVVRTRTIETFGEREAAVGEALRDLMARGRRPSVGTTATRGVIRVVVHAEGPEADVEAVLASDEAEIRRRLGAIVYGADGVTLAEVVGRSLLASRTTIAVAESCTGGLVGASLTEVPGISAVFAGGVIAYANEVKVRELGVDAALLARVGAVSEEVARAMASGVRSRFATDLGLAITGIAGPDGGTPEKPVGTVHLALDLRGTVVHRRAVLPGDRSLVREIAAKAALDLVRRTLAP
jgi:competence/damage-inducible protein CinA-like protein